MPSALIAFLVAVIDETPDILDELEKLVSTKRQQYPSVRASIVGETAAGVAALEATERK